MELLEYIKKNYKTPNVAVLRTLGASEELVEYLTNTPWNTNMKVVEGLIGGDSEDDNPGIKSITITPALETTPSLDSLFPLYWDEAQAQDGWIRFEQVLTTDTSLSETTKYTVTVTPTSEWLAGKEEQWSEAGQPFTYEATVTSGILKINPWVATEDDSAGINTLITVIGGK